MSFFFSLSLSQLVAVAVFDFKNFARVSEGIRIFLKYCITFSSNTTHIKLHGEKNCKDVILQYFFTYYLDKLFKFIVLFEIIDTHTTAFLSSCIRRSLILSLGRDSHSCIVFKMYVGNRYTRNVVTMTSDLYTNISSRPIMKFLKRIVEILGDEFTR